MRSTTSTLRSTPRASSPVPGPHISAGSRPRSAQESAAAEVVLPMPMSPSATTLAPASTSSAASEAPRSSASDAVSRLIAGPSAAFAVPSPSRRLRTAGCSNGSTTPASTTSSSAPSERASTQIAAPPDAKFASIWRVTSCGYALTPSAATPWSPAATTIAGRSGSGAIVPWTAAICAASCSSRPRLPRGFVLRSSSASAAARTSSSTGGTPITAARASAFAPQPRTRRQPRPPPRRG